MLVLLARLRPIDPLFAPVVPTVVTLTVHVADGAPPVADGVPMTGVVPPIFDVASAKFDATTPFTGSENVSVKPNGPAFVGFVPDRLIDDSVGAVLSTLYTWPVKLPLPAPPL